MLSLFVTAAILLLYFAYEQQTPRPRLILLVLAGVACGLAFLTKGFLALAVPVIVIVPFALWQGRLRICLRTAWVPLVTAFLVALPWAIAIHRREPDFWRYFFWVEHVERFTSPRGGQHPAPFWFYVPILLAGAMPWTPLVGPIVQGLRHTNRNQPMMRLAICWFVLPLLLFSASSGKLGTYILPCFPPLAFLIAVGLLTVSEGRRHQGFCRRHLGAHAGSRFLFLALVVALLLMPAMYDRVTLWEWGIAAAGLVVWVVFCRAATIQPRVHAKLALYCAGPVLFMFSWHFICAAALPPEKAPGEFLLSHAAGVSGNSIFIAENGFVGAVCWFYKRDDVLLTGRTGEYAYGLGYEDSQSRVLDVGQVEGPDPGRTRTEPVVLVLGAKDYAQYEGQLPKPCREDRREGLVWAEYSASAGLPSPESVNGAGSP